MQHSSGQLYRPRLSYSSTLGIQSFSASFEQHCEGAEPALFGTFTFQAIPEPSTLSLLVLLSLGAIGVLARRFSHFSLSQEGQGAGSVPAVERERILHPLNGVR